MGINFVIPRSFANVLTDLPRKSLGVDYPYWLGGRFNWSAQSWLVLREYREGLTIGTEPIGDRINVGHVMTWRSLGSRQGEFRLSIRADYPRLFDADFEILQNPAARVGQNSVYLPYWPVPGLIPRDVTRSGVKTTAYAGRVGPLNLARDFQSKVAKTLARFEFRVIPPDRWHDLSEIDVLVAIRSFDRKIHAAKPPSKLFSAWRAGIPLIAGWDSAFSTVGAPGRDYLRVESMEEFTETLMRLALDQAAYDSVVAAGRDRAPEVSHEAIAKVWLDAFDGPIRHAYEHWKEHGPSLRTAVLGKSIDNIRHVAAIAKSSIGKRLIQKR